MPGGAVGLDEEAVRLLIVEKAGAFGVPAEFPAQQIRDIGDDREGDDLVSDLDRHGGALPRLDAAPPVLPMSLRGIVGGHLAIPVEMDALVCLRVVVLRLLLRVATAVAAGDDERIPVAKVLGSPLDLLV